MFKKIIIILPALLVTLLVVFFFIIGGGFGKKQVSENTFLSDSLILFAHRGIVGYPENTRESLDAARRYGLIAVEIDIRQTKDDIFVLFHDVNCMRLLGKSISLSELNYRDVKQIPIIFQNKKTNNFVMTLDEFLKDYSNDFYVYLDTKTDGEKTKFEKADKLVDLLKRHKVLKSVIVANADFIFLAYIEYHYPEVLTALEGFSNDKIWIYNLIPKNFKTDFLSSSYKNISDDEIDWLKDKDMLSQRIIYHVNSKNIDKYLNKGITKMIFDYDSSYKFNYPNK
ncbi:MAG: glycerophosphodiester phosphodiesterase [bacterium]